MISVGVAGLGYWGPNLVRNFNTSPQTELAWLCETDPHRLDAIGRQHPGVRRSARFAEMLADDTLDAVAIATPAETHYSLARAALLAGKHVLIEKPMTASVSEAIDLAALADSSGQVLLVDHVFVYTPSVRKMAELVGTGELGDIQFFDAVRINLGVLPYNISVLWDLAPHDLSIIDHLIGRQPDSVTAIGASRTFDGLEDVVYLHLEYGNGLLATIHVSRLSPVKVRHLLAVGSRGTILYNDLDVSEPVKVYDREVDVYTEPARIHDVLVSSRSGDVLSPRVDPTEPLRNLVEHFADCIEQRADPISGCEQGLRIVRVLDAAQQSLSRGGERVKL